MSFGKVKRATLEATYGHHCPAFQDKAASYVTAVPRKLPAVG